MNPEVKKLWVDALRSGKYKQGFNLLARKDTFCCLGVLCELCPNVEKVEQHSIILYDGKTRYLPASVAEWAELPVVGDENNVYITNSGYGNSPKSNLGLPYFNDAVRWSFDQIADLIEKEL